jgi:hypothetical protein
LTQHTGNPITKFVSAMRTELYGKRGDLQELRRRPSQSVVKDWSETAHWNTTSHQKAKKLYDAITDNTNRVMQWIRVRW